MRNGFVQRKDQYVCARASPNRGRLGGRAQYYPVPESRLTSCRSAFCDVSRTVVLFVVEEILGPGSRARKGIHREPKQRYMTLSHRTTQANHGLS
jgi:hypothetical protein